MQKYSEIKSERDAIAKTRDQKESYIKMLLDEKQLLYEEITELKKDNRKLRDKLNNKSQSSSMNNNSSEQ